MDEQTLTKYNQSITQSLAQIPVGKASQLFQQQPFEFSADAYKYNQHYAIHFFKALAAVHNAVQEVGDGRFNPFVSDLTGCLFTRIVNLTQEIQDGLVTKSPGDDLKYCLQNVNLLSHCCIRFGGERAAESPADAENA